METVTPSPEVAALERHGTAAMVTAGLGGTWVLARGALPFDVGCPMLAATGFPCPFCGITRLTDHVLHGELGLVLTHDPAGVVFVALVALLALVGVASRLGWSPRRWPVRATAAALAVALGSHWATTLSGGGFVSG